MSEARVVVTRSDGGSQSVSCVGAGPAVVCIAGGPGRSAEYLEDLGGLSKSLQLVLPDARGTAQSDDPVATIEDDRSGWRVEAISADIEMVRQHLGLETMDLLAHSAGCSAALLYAAAHPERIGRLVLVTPSPRGFAPELSDADQIRRSRADEPLMAKALEARARLLGDPPPDPTELPGLIDAFNPSVYGTWTERAQQHAAAENDQVSVMARANFYGPDFSFGGVEDALGFVSADVLVITGDKDCVTGVAMGEYIAGLFPAGQHQTLSGVGHFPWVDDSESFRDAVLAFLSASGHAG